MAPLARVLVFAGTFALSLLAIIFITGGFTIDVGPLQVSAHRLLGPFLAAVLAYAGAAFAGRQRCRDAATAMYACVDAHAAAIAVVLASATAGVGVAYGTYAASGADAGGYISQAKLIAHRQLSFHEPLAEPAPWPDATWSFAPLGFRPGQTAGEIVPTYPPGLPVAMRLASSLTGDLGPFLVAPLLGAVCIVVTYAIGVRLHSRIAGMASAALMATSPVWLFQIVQPMSDVPATALTTVALLGALTGGARGALVAGSAIGAALLMRPNLFPLAVTTAAVLLWWPARLSDLPGRRSPGFTLACFGAWVALAGALLALVQWRLYGNPLASGHGAFDELFRLSNIAPNIRDYTLRGLRGETPALAIAAAAVTFLAVTRPPSSAAPSIAPATRVLVSTLVPVLACYLPYGVFPDWSYLRFLLPAFPPAFVVIGGLMANAAARVGPAIRGPLVVLTLVAACSANVMIARREAAFDLRTYESRYRTAGRYLDAVLPRDAVIVTSQESASAHYYTGRTVLRWDLLAADLDAAVATLRAAGRTPVLLVEDWEEPALRAKFPNSPLARLDWRSRAIFGTTTRVRLLDPGDREDFDGRVPPRPFVQDRVP